MRLMQKFEFYHSVLAKAMSDKIRELRSCQVLAWRSCNRTVSQHVWLWECWAFPRTDSSSSSWTDRICEDEHCVHDLYDMQERCHLWGLKTVLEPTAFVYVPEADFGEALFIWVSIFWCFLKGWKKMILLDSVSYLFRANLHGCWV